MDIRNNGFEKLRTYAEIDLQAIRHNGEIVKKTFPKQKILSVLKANAYGHGISGVMPAYETFTDWYAVATYEEAVRVREKSDKPILLFGPVPSGLMKHCAQLDFTFTVGDYAYAKKLSEEMIKANLHANCHLKIDTGLNRSGIRWREPESSLSEIMAVHRLPNLVFTGTYTHFACTEGEADWEIAHTQLQMHRYLQACDAMNSAGLPLGIRHCMSTGGALTHPEYCLDMVRLGMMPMGMSYSDESAAELGLQPALKWVSFIAQIKDVSCGEPISYGCTFRANRNMKIGIVTCGYADGYRRVYSNKSSVIVNGIKVPVVGRIAMDYTMIDLTDVPEVTVGDSVIMLGTDGMNSVTAYELSQFGESVSGEVTCVISERVPRIYIDGV